MPSPTASPTNASASSLSRLTTPLQALDLTASTLSPPEVDDPQRTPRAVPADMQALVRSSTPSPRADRTPSPPRSALEKLQSARSPDLEGVLKTFGEHLQGLNALGTDTLVRCTNEVKRGHVAHGLKNKVDLFTPAFSDLRKFITDLKTENDEVRRRFESAAAHLEGHAAEEAGKSIDWVMLKRAQWIDFASACQYYIFQLHLFDGQYSQTSAQYRAARRGPHQVKALDDPKQRKPLVTENLEHSVCHLEPHLMPKEGKSEHWSMRSALEQMVTSWAPLSVPSREVGPAKQLLLNIARRNVVDLWRDQSENATASCLYRTDAMLIDLQLQKRTDDGDAFQRQRAALTPAATLAQKSSEIAYFANQMLKVSFDSLRGDPWLPDTLLSTFSQAWFVSQRNVIQLSLRLSRYLAECLSILEMDGRLSHSVKKEFVHHLADLKVHMGRFEDDLQKLSGDVDQFAPLQRLLIQQRATRVADAINVEALKLSTLLPDESDFANPLEFARHPYLKEDSPMLLGRMQTLCEEVVALFHELEAWPGHAVDLEQFSDETQQAAEKEIADYIEKSQLTSLRPDAKIERPTWTEEELTESSMSTASQASSGSALTPAQKKRKRKRIKAHEAQVLAKRLAEAAEAESSSSAQTYDKAFRQQIRRRTKDEVKVSDAYMMQARLGVKEAISIGRQRDMNWLESKIDSARHPLQVCLQIMGNHETKLKDLLRDEDLATGKKLELLEASTAVLKSKQKLEQKMEVFDIEKRRLKFEFKPENEVYHAMVAEKLLRTECSGYGIEVAPPDRPKYLLDIYPIFFRDEKEKVAEGHTHRDPETGEVTASHLKRGVEAHLPTTPEYRPYRSIDSLENQQGLAASFVARSKRSAPK